MVHYFLSKKQYKSSLRKIFNNPRSVRQSRLHKVPVYITKVKYIYITKYTELQTQEVNFFFRNWVFFLNCFIVVKYTQHEICHFNHVLRLQFSGNNYIHNVVQQSSLFPNFPVTSNRDCNH